jgi:SAM-dependent methyltransferase
MAGEGDSRASEAQLHALDAQYRRQAGWFYGVRANLLRRVGIRDKRCVLELGCGTGAVTPELVRRCSGRVIALDVEAGPLGLAAERFGAADRVVASGEALPFPDGTFDLVFTQMLFLWVAAPGVLVREIGRVLKAGCELVVAAEPDWGGRIEHPEEEGLGPRMRDALRALGADPEIGRKMPGILRAEGFEVQSGVDGSIFQPDEMATAWEEERRFLASLEGRPVESGPSAEFLFMPYFWFLARRGD